MSWRSIPFKIKTAVIIDSDIVSLLDVQNFGHFIADTSSAAVGVTLESPSAEAEGWMALFTNDDTGANNLTVTCTDGFLGDLDSITIAPKDTCLVVCLEDSSGSFRWFSPDVTPA